MNSDQFPTATFNGNISNLAEIDFGKGTYKANVEGELTMHGVAQKLRQQPVSWLAKRSMPRLNSALNSPTLISKAAVAIAAGKVARNP